ncbi:MULTISPECIES: DUF960 domain-containing protein [Staphylococcus]|uniref:DUF960 domain-containing protein n=1 Tax=Staphylococcus TaxID=1279 RepID=UPI00066D86AD|nr:MULTISPECIES: DUF960 domain-containing protein [Staphylococcus]MDU4504172.1 DUF960 domain-containing protein [Staphylococcus warneri]HAY0978127.1 DUF960 domain-containing protein [Staphylococcus aureus]MCK6072495.1 DUF960 domain-containing protein [Staphylococcus epidermidis]MDH8804042.1 DUF960 domain-containing protein [Staphylococcus epidermidis]MDS0964726.1 DUF960 domain-containing protein [Staphylococcus epidermidis]
MKINRYITRGINESIPLDLQILLWHMVEEKDNHPHTDYLHIFKLQEDDNMLSVTHEQEQPAYKLEYHYTNYVENQNALPKKVYVIREDDVDTFYYVMLLPEEY